MKKLKKQRENALQELRNMSEKELIELYGGLTRRVARYDNLQLAKKVSL